MATLRELAAESIGRITRRALDAQLTQAEAALGKGERVVAVAPGHDGPAGVLIVLTVERLLLSTAAPFAKPTLSAHDVADVSAAVAVAGADATWELRIDHAGGSRVVTGMFDRDAQRLAGLLTVAG